MIRIFGSREESEVAGFFIFLHIRMMGYFRLMIAPEGKFGPDWLEIGGRPVRKYEVTRKFGFVP